MKPNSSTFLIVLLLATPAWGQSLPSPTSEALHRPLNLSLPQDVLAPPPAFVRAETDDLATRNLRPPSSGSANSAVRHPYGTGFEARQRSTTMGGSAGSRTPGGGGGRGGMGRGR
jgi:hypothetical protein